MKRSADDFNCLCQPKDSQHTLFDLHEVVNSVPAVVFLLVTSRCVSLMQVNVMDVSLGTSHTSIFIRR
jgi:hypothetical protein